jgi:F-type H+-transporting ATPase subunit epsilon
MDVDKIDLEVTTPERRVLAETVDEVILPGTDGYLGVLPGHAPLLTGLNAGAVEYRVGKRTHYIAVSAGFAEVLRNRVSILADTAERAEEIDVDRAERSKERAEKALARHDPDADVVEAEARLRRAIARIQVRRRIG